MPHGAALAGIVVLSALSQGASPAAEPAVPLIELRIYRHAAMRPAEVSRARVVVEAMVRPAGLGLSWIDCDEQQARCQTGVSGRVVIDVLILPVARRDRPGLCGETARSDSHGPGIIVSAGCARTMADQLRRGSTDPRLLTLQPADLIGLTIAHELGHVWGLPHGPRGLMVSRFDRDTVLALRSGDAGLTPNQLATIEKSIRRSPPPGSPALAAR